MGCKGKSQIIGFNALNWLHFFFKFFLSVLVHKDILCYRYVWLGMIQNRILKFCIIIRWDLLRIIIANEVLQLRPQIVFIYEFYCVIRERNLFWCEKIEWNRQFKLLNCHKITRNATKIRLVLRIYRTLKNH